MRYDPNQPQSPPVNPNVKPEDLHDKPGVKPADADKIKPKTSAASAAKPTEVVQPVDGDMPPLPTHEDKQDDTPSPKKTSPQRH